MATRFLILLLFLPLAALGQSGVSNIAALVAMDARTMRAGATVMVQGRVTPGDWGDSRPATWNPGSSLTTNAITLAPSLGTGRWKIAWDDGDVRVFGAKGDGTTDDAPAIQAAINAGNRVQLVPGDSFRVVGPLFMTNSNFELDLNRGELVLNDSSGNASLRTIPLGGIEPWTNVTALIATNITIRNGSIRADQMATGKNLVLFHGVNKGLIEDVSIFGNGTNASWALSIDGWNIRVSDCFVDNRGSLLQDGIHVFGGTNIVIENCIVLSGDDSFPVGSDNNRIISDVSINNSYGSSTHGWPIKVYTALTGPSGEMPDGPVSRIQFGEMNIRAGSVRNGAVAIFDWAFDIYSGSRTNESPPRLIQDVQLSGINVDSPVPAGGAKEVEPVPDLYIIGSERLIVERYINPTPWNNTLLVSPNHLKISDSYIGAPVRTNQATVQWLATGSGHTNYSYGIEFDGVRFDLRNDVATFNIAPFYTTNITFRNSTFLLTGSDASSAVYLGETTSDVTVEGNRFIGSSTNGAIYFGGPLGVNKVGPNWIDDNWTLFRGAKPTNAWWTDNKGKEWRTVGLTDFQVTTNGAQISRATTPSTPPEGALQLEVESLENALVMRRASGISGNFHLAGGRLNLNATGGQLALGDNFTTTTAKVGGVVGIHYDTTEEPLGIAFGQMTLTEGVVNIGGGSANLNAATETAVWGAANNTTTTGTKLASITVPGAADETSLWLVIDSNPIARVKYDAVSGVLYSGALNLPGAGSGTITTVDGGADLTRLNHQDSSEINGTLTGTNLTLALITNSIASSKIQDGTIISNDIASATITSDKMVNSGVSSGSYVNPTVTVNDQGIVTGISAGSGPITKFATISSNQITAPDISDNSWHSLLGTVRSGGNATNAAGSLTTGTIVHVRVIGRLDTADADYVGNEVRIGLGNFFVTCELSDFESIVSDDSVWTAEAWFTVASAGASATVIANGYMDFNPIDVGSTGESYFLYRSRGQTSGSLDTTASSVIAVEFRGDGVNPMTSISTTHVLATIY